MFQLNEKEMSEFLKCKNFTSSCGCVRKFPYVFTEQGIQSTNQSQYRAFSCWFYVSNY